MSDIVIAAVGIVALLFLGSVLGTLVGAFGGLVVGLFFSPTILSTLSRFGVNTYGLQVWELGATLGFIGGFLSTSVKVSGND